MIEELKNLSRNCYAFDYFLEVKRNVLLEREKIKLAVDDHYLAIYDEIEQLQAQCMTIDTEIIRKSIDNTVQIYESEIVKMTKGLDDLEAGFESWDKCYRQAEYQNRELRKNIDIYKKKLLNSMECNYVSNECFVLDTITKSKLSIIKFEPFQSK